MIFHRKYDVDGKYVIQISVILLILIPLIPYSYSELELNLNKQIFLPMDEYVFLHTNLDYVPNNGAVIQITNPYGELFINRNVYVDNEGNFEIKFKGTPNKQLTSGFYDVKVTGIYDDDVIIDESSIIIQIKDFSDIVSKTDEGGGCLIATATFGSELASQVQYLREIRDNTILQTNSGITFMTWFNQLYYFFSTSISYLDITIPMFTELVKILITPLIYTLYILDIMDHLSELELIVYGTVIILLNLLIYVVTPVFLLNKIITNTRKNILRKINI